MVFLLFCTCCYPLELFSLWHNIYNTLKNHWWAAEKVPLVSYHVSTPARSFCPHSMPVLLNAAFMLITHGYCWFFLCNLSSWQPPVYVKAVNNRLHTMRLFNSKENYSKLDNNQPVTRQLLLQLNELQENSEQVKSWQSLVSQQHVLLLASY